MNYKEILTANREDIIEIITDLVRFTNISLKDAMIAVAKNESRYNEIMETASDSYFGKTYNSFKILCKEVVDNMTIIKNDAIFENIQNSSRNNQMKSAFN